MCFIAYKHDRERAQRIASERLVILYLYIFKITDTNEIYAILIQKNGFISNVKQ